MHAAGAEWPFARRAPSMIVLLWLTRIVLVPFAIFAGFSGYRAWVQVKRLVREDHAPSGVTSPRVH
jgi:hypothetical protein